MKILIKDNLFGFITLFICLFFTLLFKTIIRLFKETTDLRLYKLICFHYLLQEW